MFKTIAAIWLLACSTAFAQVEVKSAVYYRVAGLGQVTQFGDVSLSQTKPTLTVSPVGVIELETESTDVDLTVSDAQRVTYDATQLSDKVWLIEKPGKWWVEVKEYGGIKLADGTTRRIMLDSKVVTVAFDFDPPGPNPDPDPGPGPNPSPVPNEYGVGSVAYQFAPKDAANAAKMASIYKQSGDFLFGIPSLKFVVSQSDAHSKDPSRSINAWILQQYDTLQCPDPETCKQWTVWKQKVSDALLESQKNRQFTRQDWFNAFNEISKAVGTPK